MTMTCSSQGFAKVFLVSLAGFLIACQGPPDPQADGVKRIEQAIDAHLVYGGGPVIPHVQVAVVFWNDQVQFLGSLPGFYATVANSGYLDWLWEYPSNGVYMGRGSLVQAVVDPSPPTNAVLNDTDVELELQRLIAVGTVVAPGPNTLYMVHLPPGVVVSHGGRDSCNGPGGWWCGYHSFFVVNGTLAHYGVVADLAPCGSHCGPADVWGDTTATASHELLEAVTDPERNAWQDGQSEIADICQDLLTSVAGYTVSKGWSNAQYDCVARNPCFECPGGTSCKCGDFICRPPNNYCP